MVIERMGFEQNRQIKQKYNNIAETITIGGKTIHVRSQGEKRLARYFELLRIGKHILSWDYEKTTFQTPGGIKFWKIDFDVVNNDGTIEHYEFKGAIKQSDITKLNLLAEFYPDSKINFVFESKVSAAKFKRRKISKICKAVLIQNSSGLSEFDGKMPKRSQKKKQGI